MPHDIAIIGSGISGLSLAYHCASAGRRAIVLERDDRIGGCFDSRSVEDDFWVEMGAHTFYRSYASIWEIVRACALLEAVLARRRVPFRMSARDEVHSIVSRLQLTPLAASLPRALWIRKHERTVRQYYSAICGTWNYEMVLRHMFNAVLLQELDDVPADLVLKKRKRRTPEPSPRPPKTYTVRGGVGALLDVVSRRPGIEVRTGAEVEEVRSIAGGFRLRAKDGFEAEARALGLACRGDEARRLLLSVNRDAAERLPCVGMSPVDSDAAVLDRSACKLPEVAGLVGRDRPFFSVVARDPIEHPRLRGFTFHFRPGQSPEARADVMARVLGVPQRAWQARLTRRSALPMFRAGHRERVRAFDETIARAPVLVTGNYLIGASIEDCATRSRLEFERWGRMEFKGA